MSIFFNILYRIKNYNIKDVIKRNYQIRGITFEEAFPYAQQDPRWPNRICKDDEKMVLAWVINYSRRMDYAERASVNEKRMINMPELCCICTMHMENRVSEKLVEIAASQALKSPTETARKQKIVEMNQNVNVSLSNIKTEEYQGGCSLWELSIDENEKKVTAQMSCVRFRKMRQNINEFIEISMKDNIITDTNEVTEEDIKTLFSIFEMALVNLYF